MPAQSKPLTVQRLFLAGALVGCVALAGCSNSGLTSETSIAHGYQLNEETLALIPAGSSRAQVLLSMGQPSTTLKQDGKETFYYISQIKKRSMAFQTPQVVDQRVLAIYFTQEETVERLTNYGLKDGQVFDFTRRVTPTTGKDLTFMGQLLGAAGNVSGFGS